MKTPIWFDDSNTNKRFERIDGINRLIIEKLYDKKISKVLNENNITRTTESEFNVDFDTLRADYLEIWTNNKRTKGYRKIICDVDFSDIIKLSNSKIFKN